MKKILWFITLMIIGSKFILASEVIYSNYSDFGPFSSEYIASSELVDVKTEKRYLWYKEEQVIGNYKLYDGTSNFILDDCYKGDYSSWSTSKEEKVGRTYETRTVYNYELSKPLRYIHLTNLQGSYEAFRIPELIVKVNGKEIDYNYTCDGCMDGFDEHIHNGIYNENLSYIHNGGSLIIDLKQEYPVQNVELIFYIFDLGNEDKKYTIGYSNDKKNIYATKDFVYKFSDEYWLNSKLVNHFIYDLGLPRSSWTTTKVSYSPINNGYVLNENSHKEYRYQETYCRTYTLNKKYNSVYTKNSENGFNIKDESKSKIFYSYRTRNKLELKDNLVINSYNYDLDDFVIYSSSDYQIIGDLDINKNGIYNVTFKSDGINTTKLVEVNILDNTIKTYQDEIKSLYKVIEDLNKKINDLNNKYKEDIDSKNKEIQELNNSLKLCKENCDKNLNCLRDELKNKDDIIEKYKIENEKLKEEIEDLKDQINKLEITINDEKEKNENEIQKLNNLIKDLKEDINDKEKEIELLIDENKLLKDENKKYLNDLNDLKEENKKEVEELSNNYNKKLNELNFIIQILQKEIKELSHNYNNSNLEIIELNNLINIYKEEIVNLKNEINDVSKIKEEKELLINQYYEKIVLLEKNITKLNNTIELLEKEKYDNNITNDKKVSDLESLNKTYLNKIKELELQLHTINKSISSTVTTKDKIIENCKTEIEFLKQSNIENINEYENISNELETKEKENISLNNKLNDYILKINIKNKFNLLWLLILMLILYIIYKLYKKKSNEK